MAKSSRPPLQSPTPHPGHCLTHSHRKVFPTIYALTDSLSSIPSPLVSLGMKRAKPVNHLVIVPCHGIWKGGDPYQRESWHLAPFQIQGNDHLCFIEHLQLAFDETAKDPSACMVISGGETKQEAGPVAEATSYFQLLEKMVPGPQKHRRIILENRVTTEVHARDSFENVIYSICRFYELFQTYPTRITIVGFEFKRHRFLNLHLATALGLDKEKIVYLGNAPSPSGLTSEETLVYFKDIDANEKAHATDLFARDWYGTRESLRAKKLKRNPFARRHHYASSCPDLARFLEAIDDETDSDKSNEEIRELLKDVPWSLNNEI
ncbi:uncharacterized protein LODBEIA_P26600 [Lodderomyces beijingensis]|uniref:DUF218 domain-containing protein n=1 Tax=Lodderomyces beijingensis TaxID=1775926 RepID=A0ABP0ZMT4_9ASCO